MYNWPNLRVIVRLRDADVALLSRMASASGDVLAPLLVQSGIVSDIH